MCKRLKCLPVKKIIIRVNLNVFFFKPVFLSNFSFCECFFFFGILFDFYPIVIPQPIHLILLFSNFSRAWLGVAGFFLNVCKLSIGDGGGGAKENFCLLLQKLDSFCEVKRKEKILSFMFNLRSAAVLNVPPSQILSLCHVLNAQQIELYKTSKTGSYILFFLDVFRLIFFYFIHLRFFFNPFCVSLLLLLDVFDWLFFGRSFVIEKKLNFGWEVSCFDPFCVRGFLTRTKQENR